jgi:lipopolysaccharide export system permease protein
MEIQYHQRFTIAIACFIFTLLGASLTIMSSKHSKSIAFGLSLILIFIFYSILTVSVTITKNHLLPAALALSLPNIILGLVGLILIFKVNKK